MGTRIDLKSTMIGDLPAAMLCLLMGAARDERAGRIGRFRVTPTGGHVWLVDTVAGQAWHADTEVRLDFDGFMEPKVPAGIGKTGRQ